MKKSELDQLAQRLTQLADALQGKAPGGGGLLVWLDVLADVPLDDVLAVLTDWPHSHQKMPMPADVLKLCAGRMSDRVERQSKANLEADRGWRASNLRPASNPNDPEYLKFKAWFAEFRKQPSARKIDPKGWAKRLRDEGSPDGQPLMHCQREAIRVALGELTPREQVDEAERELQAERLAIQGEGA